MNTLASTQQLWTGTKINKGKVKRDGLTQLFSINRFDKIKTIDLSRMGDWVTSERMHNLLKEIPQTSLDQVDFSHNMMGGVPSDEVLVQGIVRLKAVNLTRTWLTTNQSSKLLEASISADTLVKVNLSYVDLSRVPASLLARAVSRLQTVDLTGTHLTAQQATAMLEASLSSNILVEVSLEWELKLWWVPSEVLAKAVGRLQKVDLSNSELTGDQCNAVCQAVVSSTTLRQANLRIWGGIRKHLHGQLINSLELKDYVKI